METEVPLRHLYYAAVLPDEEVSRAVRQLQVEIARKTGAKRALKNRPHITLIPPIRVDDSQWAQWQPLLSKPMDISPFTVEFSGFGFFRNRVAFIRVEECTQLHAVRTGLIRRIPRPIHNLSSPFHPHCTLATRDVTAQRMGWIRKMLEGRQFTAQFPVMEVHFFRHNGSAWLPDFSVPLGGGA